MAELYIPDNKKWVTFFRNQAQGKFNSYQYAPHSYQAGGRMKRPARASSFIIPVDQHCEESGSQKDSKKITIQLTSPAEQIVQQAESQLKQTGSRGIKRPHSAKKVSSAKKTKQSTHPRKKASKKKSPSKTKNTKTKKTSKKTPLKTKKLSKNTKPSKKTTTEAKKVKQTTFQKKKKITRKGGETRRQKNIFMK